MERIVPATLEGDELWRRNGEYVDAESYDAATTRIADLEAENALLIDAVQMLRQELSRIADAATDMRRMPIRDLREKLHAS